MDDATGPVTATARVEPLDWDSDFFGVPIARVDLNGLDDAGLAAVDEEARDLGIHCLFGTLDPDLDPQHAWRVDDAGHRLVEVSVLYGRPDGPYSPPPTTSRVRRGTEEDLALLAGSLDVLAPWSRFACDPRFGPPAARRMHDAWVTRAACDPGRMLAIAEDDDGITGLSTNVMEPVPRVDLMGVVKPGTGASMALMGELFDWSGGGETEAGPCAARNIAVCRFVERCGFSVKQVRYLYHRWLDGAAGPA